MPSADRKYAYMKEYQSGYTVCIMYQWGAYYVGRLINEEKRKMAYTFRKYKTLSGAEKYLITKITHGKDEDDKWVRTYDGTEAYIKEGSFWR